MDETIDIPNDVVSIDTVKAFIAEANDGIEKFRVAVRFLNNAGYSFVAQKDGTNYVYRDVTEEKDGYTQTTRIAFGKPYDSNKER
jgi:hypothetical protein